MMTEFVFDDVLSSCDLLQSCLLMFHPNIWTNPFNQFSRFVVRFPPFFVVSTENTARTEQCWFVFVLAFFSFPSCARGKYLHKTLTHKHSFIFSPVRARTHTHASLSLKQTRGARVQPAKLNPDSPLKKIYYIFSVVLSCVFFKYKYAYDFPQFQLLLTSCRFYIHLAYNCIHIVKKIVPPARVLSLFLSLPDVGLSTLN